MKECIIILGMHRSGTSVLTGLTSILGCYTGFDLMKPTQDNPKGYFENNKIYLLNEKILREHKASWDDYNFTIKNIAIEQQKEYIKEAKLALEEELKYVNKTVIKDPRLCILLPIWTQALDELEVKIKVIFAYRNPLEVAYSLKHRDNIPLEKGLILWTHYFFQAEIHSREQQRIVVKYNDDFIEMDSFLEKLSQFIGLEVSSEISRQAKEFYSPSLKHHSLDSNNISDELPSYLQEIVTLLKDKQLNNAEYIDTLKNKYDNDKNYYLYNEKEHTITIEQYESSTFQLNKDIEISNKELEISNKELEITKKLASDLENKLTREANESLQQQTKLQREIDLLKSQSETAQDILNTVLNQKAIRQKLEKSASNGKLPLKLKKWRYALGKLSTRQYIRQKHIIINSGFFSPYYYLTSYPDVWKAKVDPLDHFCKFGWKENRNPSHLFNTKAYLAKNIDVAQANINPLIHYLADGKREGRLPNPSTSVSDNSRLKNNTSILGKDNPHLFGPIFPDRWLNNSSILQTLSKKNKVFEKEVPQKILDHATIINKHSSLRVSVIMPTWNREKVIGLAIDSALSQSFPIYELIIADDGSNDNTISSIQSSYAEEINSGKIKIIQNQHKGVSASRNSALEKSTGDLIAYLDSDNQWTKDFLLLMVATFEELDELNCAYAALKSYDNDKNKTFVRGTAYNRKQLLHSNFIDLNIFIHKKSLYDQLGGFDTKLKRLVDWELIIRYTKNHRPAYLPFIGVSYYLDNEKFNNISTTVSLDDNLQRVYATHTQERIRYGLDSLRIAYIVWDFPALSQTFVLNELRWLIKNNIDTKVYYSITPEKTAVLDFDIEAYCVNDAEHLTKLLQEHNRNFCHSQFIYPAVTLLTYPAAVATGINFTFMPHAVDLFHHENIKRNKIGEISQHPLCRKVFVYGEYHKAFLVKHGVPESKVAYNFQAVNLQEFLTSTEKNPQTNRKSYKKALVIARFIEKKGIIYLIEALHLLNDVTLSIDIYGYGPLEKEYKEKIQRYQLKNIHFKGSINTKAELSSAYKKNDFLIVPSVVAENGDMDGFPTVILEAMAAQLPVVSTDVSAIPDYLNDNIEAIIVPSKDPKALANGIRKLINMPTQQVQAMTLRAKHFLQRMTGVDKSLQVMLDTWQDYRINIFLVTYNTKEYDDHKETFEIIRRILLKTSTPFTLTIIDNGSEIDFWEQIKAQVKGLDNVRLIRKQKNQFCGPASNIALELTDTEYAIYICSKEGFIKNHAWERYLIDYMRSNPDIPMGGHLCQIPSYIYGSEYQKLPYFKHFRNKQFAKKNPDRPFKHIQGGIYIIRRSFFAEHGGFNHKIPHNGMDVEMSYYIESCGYKLGNIIEVASITVKTRPSLTAIMNEHTVIAHPLTYETAHLELDTLNNKSIQRCNLCGQQEKNITTPSNNCPQCRSTPFGRIIYKMVSNNQHIHRQESCMLLSNDKALKEKLQKLFKLEFASSNSQELYTLLNKTKQNIDVFILDPDLIEKNIEKEIWELLLTHLKKNGEIIYADSNMQSIATTENSKKTTLEKVLEKQEKQYTINYQDISSDRLTYDWRRIGTISQPPKSH